MGVKKGQKLPKWWRDKLSQAKKGKPSPWKGKSASPEVREKISNSLKGRQVTDEHRRKNREGQIRRFTRSNPDYVMASRNARIVNNGGFHSKGEWETLKSQYNWTCPSCLRAEPEVNLTKDHIIPLLKGGSDNIENIQPLCRSCNCKKHTLEIRYEIPT